MRTRNMTRLRIWNERLNLLSYKKPITMWIMDYISSLVSKREEYESEIWRILNGWNWESKTPCSTEEQKKRNIFFVRYAEFRIDEIDKKLQLLNKEDYE